MSPLVALFALACAAPLTVQSKKPNKLCTTVLGGRPTPNLVDVQPSEVILPKERNVDIDLNNNCSVPFNDLVGVVVTVCDDQEPFVDVPLEAPFSPVKVRRTGSATDATEVYIIQYCELWL